MVLFTSRSLLTWGEISKHLTWYLRQVFACYLLLMNYIPLSFIVITPWQNMTSSYKKQAGGEKIWLPCGGTSIFALNFTGSNSSVILRQNCPP